MCDFSNGCFNTNTEEKEIYMFNKPSGWTFRDWTRSEAHRLLISLFCDSAIELIRYEKMTSGEKEQHPEAEITGGYLKIPDKTHCAHKWWDSLSLRERLVIKSIPNFDKEIFKEITGVDVDWD